MNVLFELETAPSLRRTSDPDRVRIAQAIQPTRASLAAKTLSGRCLRMEVCAKLPALPTPFVVDGSYLLAEHAACKESEARIRLDRQLREMLSKALAKFPSSWTAMNQSLGL